MLASVSVSSMTKSDELQFKITITEAFKLARYACIPEDPILAKPACQYARILHRIGYIAEADLLLDELCSSSSTVLTSCTDLLRHIRKLESSKYDGNEAYLQGRYSDSIRLFSEALTLDPSNDYYNSVILSNRAAAFMALGYFQQACFDCDSALKLEPSFSRARIRRARSLVKLGKIRESIQDFEIALRSSPSISIAKELAEAKQVFSGSSTTSSTNFPPNSSQSYRNQFYSSYYSKKIYLNPKPKQDWYGILGLNPKATAADIKKAYYRLALIHHPDKNIGDKHAVERFKQINDAFAILSDPIRRKKYDSSTSSVGVQAM